MKYDYMVTAIEKEDKLCSDFHFIILIEWRRIRIRGEYNLRIII